MTTATATSMAPRPANGPDRTPGRRPFRDNPRLILAGIGFALSEGSTRGQDSSPNSDEIKALLKRIEDLEQKVKQIEESKSAGTNAADTHLQELDQKVRMLERKLESQNEPAQSMKAPQPRLSAGADGFSFSSADTNFVLKLRGIYA